MKKMTGRILWVGASIIAVAGIVVIVVLRAVT